MIHRTFLVFIIAFFAVAGVHGQRRPARHGSPDTSVGSKRVPVYEMHLRILASGRLTVAIASPKMEPYIDPLDLTHLIADLPGGADKFNTPNNAFPRVMIEADPGLVMLGFWNPVTLFRQNRTEIRLSVPDPSGEPIEIAVPWERSDPNANVKPNPLSLIVRVADDGNLILNGERMGTLTDTKPLSDQLSEIFKAREVNGVFREGSNEIEKSVTIVMPMTSPRKIADLITVASAIRLPRGGPVSLVMDDPRDLPQVLFTAAANGKTIVDAPASSQQAGKKP